MSDDLGSDSHAQLALQFELRELIPRTAVRWNGPTSRAVKPGQEPGSGMYRLGTRPALRTKRGWARGNLTWSNIGHQGGRLSLDTSQQRWFQQLFALHRAATTITVGLDSSWVFLDDFVSPALWAMFDHAEDLGIKLVTSGTHAPVQFHSEAELCISATTEPGGELHLQPLLRFDGCEVSLRGSGPIGDHGLYLVARDEDRAVHRPRSRWGLKHRRVGAPRLGGSSNGAYGASRGAGVISRGRST